MTAKEFPLLQDQDHVILDDYTIVSVHGALHPPDHLVGEVIYLPDRAGSHCLFGRRYRKAYQRAGRGLPEEERFQIRDRTSSFFDSAPLFGGKSIIHQRRVRRYVPCADLTAHDQRDCGQQEVARRLWESARQRLEIPSDGLQVALTGSLNLDPDQCHVLNPNDVDLIFTGSTAVIGGLVTAMSAATQAYPAIRVYEYGKGWQIRMRTEEGLLCSFFRYANADETPLRDLEYMRTVRERVEIRGTVAIADHNVYMPAILEVDLEWTNVPDALAATSRLPVLIYHLRSRGDFFRGDKGYFRGTLLEIVDGSGRYLALSVGDGTSSQLLTPPWTPY